jgi:hypothetical protein
LAKDLDVLPTTLNQFFNQDSLQCVVLLIIFKVLNYSFLVILAEYLHIQFETIKMKEIQNEIDNKKIIEKFRTENRSL